MSTYLFQLELTRPIPEFDSLEGYSQAQALVRFRGQPLGSLRVPVEAGRLDASSLRQAILQDPGFSWRLSQAALQDWLLQGEPPPSPPQLSWTAIVCTRNRTADLQHCLEGLLRLDTTGLARGEILVVDNAPSDESTAELASRYPVRYVREDRVGLNWARSCGARAAQGEIVLFTDDDVVVDPGWAAALLAPFSHPRVAAVTGLTQPLELETKAQELFEVYGGFGRGFSRRTFDYTRMAPAAAGIVGAGANMALRRDLVNTMGLFDAELDCGTVVRTGGDAYAFYRLLVEGFTIVYDPAALVWHRHRREYAALRRTLVDYSVGGFAFLTRCWLQHGDWQAPGVAVAWLFSDHLRQLGRALLRRPNRLPLDLVLAQIMAIPRGPWAYFQSRRQEQSGGSPALGAPSGNRL